MSKWYIGARVGLNEDGDLDSVKGSIERSESMSLLWVRCGGNDPGTVVAIWDYDRAMTEKEAEQWSSMMVPSRLYVRTQWSDWLRLDDIQARDKWGGD